jgi:invasion protein IalB
MQRSSISAIATLFSLALAAVLASTVPPASKPRQKDAKPAQAAKEPGTGGADSKAAEKPSQAGSFGDWGVFVARGEKSKTCYALASPKERAPAGLNRDPAYLFVSTRPGENVREEFSVIFGFPAKEDSAKAEVSGASFALIAKGSNAWIKNQAEESRLIDALKKGSKLVIKAASARGNVTTDTYSLSGLSQALEKVEKECP